MGLDTISTPQDEVLFATVEASFGTAVHPAGAAVVPLLGAATFKQPKGKFDDPQKKLTVSQLARIPGGYSPGEFSFNMMVKPSGALGTPCRGSVILKAGFGKQTTTGSTSDVHSLQGINDDVLGVTIVHRKGHRVTWNSGCVINKLTFPVKANNSMDAEGQVQVSGQFCKQVQAGYAYVHHATQYAIGAVDIVLHDAAGAVAAHQFEVGARVRFRNATTGAIVDDNTGHDGFLISVVVAATGTITIPAITAALADGVICDGFTPTVSDAGTSVFGRLGIAQECLAGGTLANIIIMDAQVNIENGFKIKDDEKTGTWWPATAIRVGKRKVTCTVNKVFTKGEALYFAESRDSTLKHISLPVGDIAGSRYRLDLPTIDFDSPELSDGDEVGIGRTGVALASGAYDDEVTLTFD